MTPELMEELLAQIAQALNLDDASKILERIEDWRGDRDKAWAEVERLQKLIDDCRPLDDAIRKQERKRAAARIRDAIFLESGNKHSLPFEQLRCRMGLLADEIEGGAK